MYRAQQLDLLIRTCANARSKNGYHHGTMKLMNAGVVKNHLRELARRFETGGSIHLGPPVRRQDSMREMARVAVLHVNLQVDKAFPRTISSKVSDCMAVGGSIPAGVSRSILESPKANVCLEMGKQEDVDKFLMTLVAEYDGLCQETRGNPKVIRNDYTREKAAGILRDAFRLVTSNGRVVPTTRS